MKISSGLFLLISCVLMGCGKGQGYTYGIFVGERARAGYQAEYKSLDQLENDYDRISKAIDAVLGRNTSCPVCIVRGWKTRNELGYETIFLTEVVRANSGYNLLSMKLIPPSLQQKPFDKKTYASPEGLVAAMADYSRAYFSIELGPIPAEPVPVATAIAVINTQDLGIIRYLADVLKSENVYGRIEGCKPHFVVWVENKKVYHVKKLIEKDSQEKGYGVTFGSQ